MSGCCCCQLNLLLLSTPTWLFRKVNVVIGDAGFVNQWERIWCVLHGVRLMCGLGDIGDIHYFHTKNLDPDETRCDRDDPYTTYISWPNYHSGANGDYQKIIPISPIHPTLKNPHSPAGIIEFFPTHPHEGGIGIPPRNPQAQVIAMGKSLVTGRDFNLIVAIDRYKDEQNNLLGRTVAHASFHHFVDYNWDIDKGCPSFVDEPPGNGMKNEPRALQDIQTYTRNVALWLADAAI